MRADRSWIPIGFRTSAHLVRHLRERTQARNVQGCKSYKGQLTSHFPLHFFSFPPSKQPTPFFLYHRAPLSIKLVISERASTKHPIHHHHSRRTFIRYDLSPTRRVIRLHTPSTIPFFSCMAEGREGVLLFILFILFTNTVSSFCPPTGYPQPSSTLPQSHLISDHVIHTKHQENPRQRSHRS